MSRSKAFAAPPAADLTDLPTFQNRRKPKTKTPPSSSPQPTSPSTAAASKTNQKPPEAPSHLHLEPLPNTPSAPSPVLRQPNLELFFCKREFSLDGARKICDSPDRYDGEQLRPLFEGSIESTVLLNEYQRVRERAKIAAYIGTAGLLLSVFGPLIFSMLKEKPDGNPNADPLQTETSLYLATAASLGGITLAGGAIVIGLTLLRANENRLLDAVQLYNQNHPSRPVELLFSTGVKF